MCFDTINVNVNNDISKGCLGAANMLFFLFIMYYLMKSNFNTEDDKNDYASMGIIIGIIFLLSSGLCYGRSVAQKKKDGNDINEKSPYVYLCYTSFIASLYFIIIIIENFLYPLIEYFFVKK